MANLQLYSQGFGQGIQTFTLAEANLLEATAGTHYTQNTLIKTTNPITQDDVWTLHLTIPIAGMDYLTVNKNFQPLPSEPLVNHEGSWYSSAIDITAETLDDEPSDWALHWRDKYNSRPVYSWNNDTNHYYYEDPTIPQNYSGDDPVFVPNFFYEDNQSRHIYWTMDGNYLPLEWGWYKGYTFETVGTGYQGLRFSWSRYGYGNVNWTNQYQNVNNPRFSGVNGQLVYGNGDFGGMSFLESFSISSLTGTQKVSHIYFNFIGFKYHFIDNTGDNPIDRTEEFIGLVAWRESDDGIPQEAQIAALSKNFFGAREKPANGGPISGIQGGNGVFDAPSNNHGDRSGAEVGSIVNAWDLSARSLNFYNMYIMGGSYISVFKNEFIDRLWDPNGWRDAWQNLFINPMDALIQCHIMPSGLLFPYYTADDYIRLAGSSCTETKVPTFNNMYHMKHIGDIDISAYTDSFADYTNSAIYINLPYVGCYELDISACMNGWISVDYGTDVYTGDCTAFVSVCDRFGNSQIRYEWKGNCSRKVELRQRQNPGFSLVSKILPSAIGLGVGLATGSATASAMAASAPSQIADALIALDPKMSSEELNTNANFIADNMSFSSGRASTVAQGIATSATTAALSGQATATSNASGGTVSSPINTNCWVLITRPQWSNPELYARQKAYPSDISGKISDFSGFLSARSAELNSIDCTDVERSEIMQRLISGVLLS